MRLIVVCLLFVACYRDCHLVAAIQPAPAKTCVANLIQSGHCVPLMMCVFDIQTIVANLCHLNDPTADFGICCPDTHVKTTAQSVVKPPTVTFIPPVPTTTNPTAAVGAKAKAPLSTPEIEKKLVDQGLVAKPDSTAAVHQEFVHTFPEAQELSDKTAASIGSVGITTKIGGQVAAASATCEVQPTCTASKYRSFDGTCNNIQNGNWGKSNRAFNRLMTPQYADGVGTPRTNSVDGTPLKSTRVVSNAVLGSFDTTFPDVSLMFANFGQFTDHDLTLTPGTRGANGAGIICCDPAVIAQGLQHPACLTIAIPTNDPFYAQFNQTCMEFVRSLPTTPNNCSLDYREQINSLTAFIDASQVYGNTEDQAKALRSKVQGKLTASSGVNGREFPTSLNSASCTGNVANLTFCLRVGDVRATETPQLGTLQVLFFREHNRVAGKLAQLNPSWDDNKLYLEARRIVGAKLQHITYNEFLPTLLTYQILEDFGLLIQTTGYWNYYNSSVDPTILNEFAAASYRYGHSNIPSVVQLFTGTNNVGQQLLRDHFSRPYEGGLIDKYVNGLSQQQCMLTDNQITKELLDHLFERGQGFGIDLPATNMQRGRDHAIGTYVQARKTCGLSVPNTFEDMIPYMYDGVPAKLKTVYKSVKDIDLWLGGVAEKRITGAAVGPTVACIVAEQFWRIRIGDSHWYERGGAISSFTSDQLQEIRKTSIARIMCDNSDIVQVPPLAFWLTTFPGNSIIQCNNTYAIPVPDLAPWKV